MKIYVFLFLLAVVVVVKCGHTFLGTSVQRKLIYHKDAKYPSKLFQKRIENVNYTIPFSSHQYSPSIQVNCFIFICNFENTDQILLRLINQKVIHTIILSF